MHAYAISYELNAISGGHVAVARGTLAWALKSLIRHGYIKVSADNEDRRRTVIYEVTRAGAQKLTQEIKALERAVRLGRFFTLGPDPDSC